MKNSYNKLINNSIIFAIGNLGNKLIVFFLVPIYTYYLSKNDFGLVDLLTSTLNFILPIFSLSIFDSVLRFCMDRNYDKEEVLTNSLVVICCGFLCSFIIYPVFSMVLPFDGLMGYFYIILLLQLFYTTFNQFIRAIGLVKLYSFVGILNSIILLISNLIFLVNLSLGIKGYLLSFIVSNVLCITVIFICAKISKYISLSKMNLKLTKELLLYSTPLIPNALMWWIMGLSDRYIVTFYLGLSANGLYAVANKIPSILNVLNSIFFQAWQMSAIEEANSKERSKFYSNVFKYYSIFLIISTSLLLVFLKLLLKLLVASNFYTSWKYIPLLLIGVVFSCYSSFLGTNYIASKKTRGVFKTSILGATVNIICNFIFIPWIGINGASLSTMLSFFIIWVVRIIDTRQFVDIKLNYRKMISSFVILACQITVLYLGIPFEIFLELLLFAMLIILNKNEVLVIVSKLLLKLNKK